MKGIPLFASVENPKKGDMVFWTKDDNMVRRPWVIDVVINDKEVLLEWVHDEAAKISDLQRVVIAYNEVEKLDETEISSKFFPSPVKKSVPLFKDDYRSIIRLMSMTVDFGIMPAGVEYGLATGEIYIPDVDTAKLYHTQNIADESWGDVLQKFKEETGLSAFLTNTFATWLMKNYNAPKKK